MKKQHVIYGLLILLCACRGATDRDFLKGTFVSSVSGTYSMARDTLEVEPGEGKNFQLHRKTGFRIIENGKAGNWQYQKEEWQAVFDESTGSLQELRKGKLIQLFPDSGFILIGRRKYHKQ